MNTFGPVNTQSSYLPTDFTLPGDWDRCGELIAKRERLTARIINVKENGQYELNEILSGQQYFSTDPLGTPRRPRYVFRTIVNFGALPSTTTKTVAHNIAITPLTIFTHIYGTATNPNTKFIPIPYINTGTPGDSVEIWVDATNVNIKTTSANYIAFTTVYVVLEYIKN